MLVERYIDSIHNSDATVLVDRYVIMPNHIHLIIIVTDLNIEAQESSLQNDMQKPMSEDGTPRSSSPTGAVIPTVIAVFKRLTNLECGINIWQRSYHDHIIRSDEEYQ